MTFNEYQARAHALAFYPENRAIEYVALKLAGEAGEVAEKVGKMIRDGMPDTFHQEIAKELGDVLWYVQEMAGVVGYTLSDVADLNMTKLESRKTRGVLGGSGDNR